MENEFTATPAVRKRVPLLLGLMGASGSGKTCSALRLAKGIQRVESGPVVFIDTESGRALQYADDFDFLHMRFEPPYTGERYIQALEAAASHKPACIIIDSMSHEHDGEGGVLDQHDKAMGGNHKKQFTAWGVAKKGRKRLIQRILKLEANVIFCFRAQRKVKPDKSGKPVDMGWMPIAAPEIVFEMTACCLLPPGSNGVPNWMPTEPGESEMVKIIEPLRKTLEQRGQLTEEIGAELAAWSSGDKDYLALVADAPTLDALETVKREAREAVKANKLDAATVKALKGAIAGREAELAAIDNGGPMTEQDKRDAEARDAAEAEEG